MTSAIGLFICALSSAPAQAGSREKLLAVTVQGDGAVTSSPGGVSCTADCTESYKRQRYVTLTASAGPDAKFLGWESACIGTQPTCTVRLRGLRKVTALFEDLYDNETTQNSEGAFGETDPASQQVSAADDQGTVPDAGTAAAISIQLGWPAFSVQ
jgi:hypothetical protein